MTSGEAVIIDLREDGERRVTASLKGLSMRLTANSTTARQPSYALTKSLLSSIAQLTADAMAVKLANDKGFEMSHICWRHHSLAGRWPCCDGNTKTDNLARYLL